MLIEPELAMAIKVNSYVNASADIGRVHEFEMCNRAGPRRSRAV